MYFNDLIGQSCDLLWHGNQPVLCLLWHNNKPVLCNNQQILCNNQPVLCLLWHNNKPVLCNNQQILCNNQPVLCLLWHNNQPILCNNQQILCNKQPVLCLLWHTNQPILCFTVTQQSANLVSQQLHCAASPCHCHSTQYTRNDTLHWFLSSAAAHTKRHSYELPIPYQHEAFIALTT